MDLLMVILATWRLTALLCYDDWFAWLRQLARVDFVDTSGRPITVLGRILYCFWCTSIISAIITTIVFVLGVRMPIYMLAASGGAIILHHWTRIVRDVNYGSN